MAERVVFTLNGRRFELSRDQVEASLEGVAPEVVRKHAVRVNDAWFPAVQAFEAATGVPRAGFISHTARRHLADLGFETHGDIESRADHQSWPAAPSMDALQGGGSALGQEWHTESNVQALLVTEMASTGWLIRSVANTATKEHGVDVLAERDGITTAVEVKGYPSRNYADPGRSDQRKRTAPSTQAGHWFAQAILAAMRLRGRHPDWHSVIAVPDFPRYRDLHADTATSLQAASIEVWWVDNSGTVSRP